MMKNASTTTDKETAKVSACAESGFARILIQAVVAMLQLFMPDTLAKRIPTMILLAAGMPEKRIAELTGASERSVYRYRKQLSSCETAEEIAQFLTIKKPSRTRSKTWGLEEEIIAEVEKHNCRTRQEAAEIIKDEFGIELSVTAVGKLLKKGGSKRGNAGLSPQKQT